MRKWQQHAEWWSERAMKETRDKFNDDIWSGDLVTDINAHEEVLGKLLAEVEQPMGMMKRQGSLIEFGYDHALPYDLQKK
jgi:hypothetical protein